MKKIRLLLILMLVVTLLSACTPQAEGNKAPTVVGVKDVQCLVNSTVDFLDGVAALDKDDGDITPQLTITVEPHVDVSDDGYATFTEEGEYTVNYQIEDSDGRTAQKKAYVDVVDRETYLSFGMPDGYSVVTAGSAEVTFSGMSDGAFKVQADGGEIAEDVQILHTFTVSADEFVKRQYQFSTQLKSDREGKVLVLCNGEPSAELAVTAGDNVLKYSCTCPDDETQTTCDVEVALCVGALGSMELVVGNTDVTYPQQGGATVDRTPDFSFNGTVTPRINTDESAGLEGNAWALEDGSGARVEITHEGEGAIYNGGMFINSNVQLKPNTTYTVSFDLERHTFPIPQDGVDEEPNFNVLIKPEQWNDDTAYKTLSNPQNGTIEETFTTTNSATLWLSVQTGTQCNQITISNLHVKEHLAATGTDSFAVTDFTCFNFTAGYEFHSELGNITYRVQDFDATDSHHVVTSPSFWVAGSGANYVVQFRIKATEPIEFVVAGPISDGWDPTLLWQRVYLTADQEYTLAFVCNAKTPQGVVADRWYKLVWQFGASGNTQYHDVTIQIYDIRVCKRDAVLDS